VIFWLNHFAPDSVKFKIQKSLPNINLSDKQIKFLDEFLNSMKNIRWDAESIHNQIYAILEKQDIEPMIAFSSIYQVLLKQTKGPRIGYFLSNLEIDFVRNRFKEAIK
jgi:lysyl-tRNA synthetase class 1